jgi:hypothetical protein
MRRAVWALWFLAACAGAGGRGKDPAPLVAEAERLLARSAELDYAAPAKPTRRDQREAAAALFLEACGLGDRRACWMAATHGDLLAPSHDRAMRAVIASCRAGDRTSCRFLDSSRNRVFLDTDVAAEACKDGLGVGCPHMWTQEMTEAEERALAERGCELGDARSCGELDASGPRTLAALRRECEAGYPTSCEEPRQLTLAEEGCRTGILAECQLLSQLVRDDPARQAAALAPLCHHLGLRCADLSFLHRPPHKNLPGALPDAEAERDAYEHACQHSGEEHFCKELAQLYEMKEIPEPHPGRAKEIRAFLAK